VFGELYGSTIGHDPAALAHLHVSGIEPQIGILDGTRMRRSREAQDAALHAAGCAKVYAEKVSGARSERPELAKVLKRLEPGDVLMVRLGCMVRPLACRRADRAAHSRRHRGAGAARSQGHLHLAARRHRRAHGRPVPIFLIASSTSGQINMRKVDGWQTLATTPIDQPIDLAA
jgi:hypothetical protein